MPQPTVFDAMEKFRAALLRRERKAAKRLVDAYGDVYKRLQPDIRALQAEIEALDGGTPAKLGKLRRWKALRADIVDEMNRYGAVLDNHLVETTRESVRAATAEARATVEAALPGVPQIDAQIMASWNKLPAAAVENLLGFLADDSPLRQSLRTQMGEALAEQVEKKLVAGLAMGSNPRKIAKIIRNELGQGLTWSLRTARTANLYAYREASRASYAANSKIVSGWTWRATLDELTCMSCVVQDGTVHGLDERLNDHYNGRCWMEPKVKSYKELGFSVAEPQRPTRQAGQEWFAGLSPATQRKMMGNAKFEAWQDGRIDLQDLSHTHADPIWGEMRVEASLKSLLK